MLIVILLERGTKWVNKFFFKIHKNYGAEQYHMAKESQTSLLLDLSFFSLALFLGPFIEIHFC